MTQISNSTLSICIAFRCPHEANCLSLKLSITWVKRLARIIHHDSNCIGRTSASTSSLSKRYSFILMLTTLHYCVSNHWSITFCHVQPFWVCFASQNLRNSMFIHKCATRSQSDHDEHSWSAFGP
jgi:hypothetical protein